ncbi:cytochrome c oxidase polypeptide iv, precursor [Trichosporon asahii var. asahii CBS 2479]|uniref:Cytochrome c oxidase polypeptide iv n=1 Tax=Trichosporon asahii var. asahii (strain ATCC 90039 / CBS 2479 / JCM 2466 / KCTC 7840 / NBRC 103889/ NCYC 2677 / UAMH 7654) TaxID=1186058 RepID=J6END7_TRIAS|nr:cytochrome c oxidase polypeptide iv, precursor [Trichosporon asahii var. asahii CBS 2479]EJT45869.1 cytochrome c oxidase polypeptide iv, precursor [Trichosporon asahii var. asahii CBS 2479]
MVALLRSLRAAQAVARPALAARPAARAFSLSAIRLGGAQPPELLGPGVQPGQVPTERSVEGGMEDWTGGIKELRIAQTKRRHAHTHSEQQATGIERFELMGKVQGVDVFDMKPLEADRIGTLADPIEVLSYYPVRQVGCTGFPADSHDTLWIDVTAEKKHARCTECGSVYTLKYEPHDTLSHGHH